MDRTKFWNSIYIGSLALIAGVVMVALFMPKPQPAQLATSVIDEDVSVIHVSDEIIVVMGPQDNLRVTRIREPAAAKVPPVPSTAAPKQLLWTLPYSCADVRYYKRTFTPAQLEGMRKVAGVRTPSPAEMQQINACLAGRIK